MMRFTPAVVSLLLVFPVGCGDGNSEDEHAGDQALIAPPPIPMDLRGSLESWLAENGAAPIDYVLGLYEDHDVVIIGEQHRIKHDVIFIQELLPQLYDAGIRVLATEWARRVDQPLLDSLVTSPEWDERLGREIIFRQFVPWGYREYLDVLKAAWRVNRDRPAGAPPFRVLAVNHAYDYSHFKTEDDMNDDDIWERVRSGQTEADWAAPVLAAVERGERVVAHCGIHHAFSGYRQPRVSEGRFVEWGTWRFGNALRETLGSRVITVFLHAPWNGPAGYDSDFVHPADGRLDAFMLGRDGGPFPVGFDVVPSPLGDLPIEAAVYRHGYDPFTLSNFCDGWIYSRPISEFQPVVYIDGWVNDENIQEARRNAMNPRMRDDTVEQFNDGCRSYTRDFQRFFGHLR